MKLILLYFNIKTSFIELFEHFFNMPVVYKHVVRVDKYIIKINYNTNIQKIREYVIYESLKGCRDTSKTKRWYKLFKRVLKVVFHLSLSNMHSKNLS